MMPDRDPNYRGPPIDLQALPDEYMEELLAKSAPHPWLRKLLRGDLLFHLLATPCRISSHFSLSLSLLLPLSLPRDLSPLGEMYIEVSREREF